MHQEPALPTLSDLRSSARVVSLPLATRFRGIDHREALLLEGPQGWTEFSPFVEYDDDEAAAWLAAAIDFGWNPHDQGERTELLVNATMPAVGPSAVAGVLARFPGCRTVKVKVAEPGQVLGDDVDRVAAVRDILGPDGRIRVDANGAWTVDEAERAVHALARYDLEYVEQPCATVDDLWQIRQRIKYMGIPVAADESVRKAADPLRVARHEAADILVIKAQPLGGITAALRIVREAALPVVVSSALDTSIGLSMGAHLAAAIPDLQFDSGLGTAALLAADVTHEPLTPADGRIAVRRVTPSSRLLDEHAASAERTEWWMSRLSRCYDLLASDSWREIRTRGGRRESLRDPVSPATTRFQFTGQPARRLEAAVGVEALEEEVHDREVEDDR